MLKKLHKNCNIVIFVVKNYVNVYLHFFYLSKQQTNLQNKKYSSVHHKILYT